MNKFLLCLVFSILPALLLAQDSDAIKEQADSYRRQGGQLLSQGKLQEALMYYQKAAQMQPHCSECFRQLGTVYEALHDITSAIAMYKKALHYNPHYTQACMDLASLHEAGGNRKEAIRYWKEAYFLSRGSPELRQTSMEHLMRLIGISLQERERLIAIVQRKSKKLEEAVSFIPEIAKEQAKMYRSTGYTLQKLGDFEQALVYYQKALEMNPYYYEVYNDAGLAYEALNKKEDAVAIYKEAIALNPSYLAPYANLALLYEARHEPKRALSYWKRRFLLGTQRDFWTEESFKHLVDLIEKYPEEGNKF